MIVDTTGRGLVVVSGPDATTFLQSLVSADLGPVADGGGVASLLLTPQGKLDVAFRALRLDEQEWWLETDESYGPRLAASLARFRIRVKVDIADRSGDLGSFALRGDDAERVPAPAEPHAHVAWRGARVVRCAWPDVTGADVIGPRADVERLRAELVSAGATPAEARDLEALRIEAGVARMGADLDDRTIPQEAFLERDAVSFTKGCFLGQELVCRIDTRGHVNRYLRRFRLDGDPPGPGSAVEHDGRVVGEITSAAPRPGGGAVALGYVRREVEPPATVTVEMGADRRPATIS
jgi:folate-binding protein YgfZ